MSEMVERVARALTLSDNNGDEWWVARNTSDADREYYRELARAAIEAMREPTYEMRFAVPPRVLDKLTYRDLGDTWKGMIDAALSPGSSGGHTAQPTKAA